MSFNSTQFVAFFVVVYFASWALARATRSRLALLFVASCLFYMSWNAKFILLILFSAVLDFFLGRAIHASASEPRRRLLLTCSLVGNLGLLGFFKYFNFFAENWVAALHGMGLTEAAAFEHWDIVLPVGISFYTFQTLSYTLDIYRRQLEPTDSFLKFALFVAFFPQLVAGPIVRATQFLPQLERRIRRFARRRSVEAPLPEPVPVRFHQEGHASGRSRSPRAPGRSSLCDARPNSRHRSGTWLATCTGARCARSTCDFSGLLRHGDRRPPAMLGYQLVDQLPLDRTALSQSITDFWRRWHISLSTWFRDYVFFSLGGTRTHALGRFKNILVTMLLTGLWHGAGWNYVIWGGMHGVLTWVGTLFGRTGKGSDPEERSLPNKLVRRIVIFNLVALSMLFFRNGTVAEGNRGVEGSLDMLRLLFEGRAGGVLYEAGWIALALAAAIHFTPKAWVFGAESLWMRTPTPLRALALVVLTGVLAVVAVDESPFIYFQF